ncbi:hypothetical protein ACJZ2D_002717 [Fusarium nematophilum]
MKLDDPIIFRLSKSLRLRTSPSEESNTKKNIPHNLKMAWQKPPVVDFLREPEWRWTSWNVGLEQEDLFGDLHELFNTTAAHVYPRLACLPYRYQRDCAQLLNQGGVPRSPPRKTGHSSA